MPERKCSASQGVIAFNVWEDGDKNEVMPSRVVKDCLDKLSTRTGLIEVTDTLQGICTAP